MRTINQANYSLPYEYGIVCQRLADVNKAIGWLAGRSRAEWTPELAQRYRTLESERAALERRKRGMEWSAELAQRYAMETA